MMRKEQKREGRRAEKYSHKKETEKKMKGGRERSVK